MRSAAGETGTHGETGADAEAPSAEASKNWLRRRLLVAGLDVHPAFYLAGLAVAAGAVFVLVRGLLPQTPIPAFVAALFAAYGPDAAVRSWGRFRAQRFEKRLVDAIDHMVSALAGGENATQALASAAAAAEEPVRSELREVLDRLDLGMPIDRALARIVEGYDSEGTRIFIRTLSAKMRAGGNLAPVLKSVNRIIRERLKLRLKLQGQLSGAQFSAIAIAILPYTLLPFYVWRKPDWIARLLDHPLGPQLLFFAFLLQVFGFLWLRRILRMELT